MAVLGLIIVGLDSRLFLYVSVSPFSWQGPWMWRLCLSSSFWDTHSCLYGDSGILCISLSLVMFLVTSPKPFCSSLGRELHLPVALCWLFCVGCLFFVFGSLMNNRHGHTLGCLFGLFFFMGSPGSEGWWKSSERTYIYTFEKLAICPHRDKAWQFLVPNFTKYWQSLLVFQQSLVDQRKENKETKNLSITKSIWEYPKFFKVFIIINLLLYASAFEACYLKSNVMSWNPHCQI